jgi:hypothetical protein
MHPMAIIGFALGVGAIVFAISFWGEEGAFGLRSDPGTDGGEKTSVASGLGFAAPAASETSSADDSGDLEDSFTYVPVVADILTWRTRASGLLGLVLVVGLAAAVLAIGVYQVAHVLNETIGKFLGK